MAGALARPVIEFMFLIKIKGGNNEKYHNQTHSEYNVDFWLFTSRGFGDSVEDTGFDRYNWQFHRHAGLY